MNSVLLSILFINFPATALSEYQFSGLVLHGIILESSIECDEKKTEIFKIVAIRDKIHIMVRSIRRSLIRVAAALYSAICYERKNNMNSASSSSISVTASKIKTTVKLSKTSPPSYYKAQSELHPHRRACWRESLHC